jgi:putative holliday junction resolvase
MNYLGLDWGKSKLGIAFGSDVTKLASPIMILDFKTYTEAIEKLKELVEKEEVEVIVLGKPVSLSGKDSLSKDYNKFVALLEGLEGVKIEFEDERLSTKLAGQLNREFKGYKKVGDDDLAAAAILQTYFDRM